MRVLGLLLLTSCATASGPVEGGDGVDDGDVAGGEVTIEATAGGAPMGSALVIAHAADGTTIARATTDATGHAQIAVAPFITLVTPFTDETASKQLVTLEGARAGETLRFATSAPRPIADVTFRVTAPPDPGAASYRIVSTCGAGGSYPAPEAGESLDLSVVLAGCTRPADLAIVSLDASNTALQAIWRTGVTLTSSAAIAITGSYQPIARATIDYTRVPSIITGLATERGIVTSRGMLAWEGRTVPASSGAARVALAVPPLPHTTEVIRTYAAPINSALTRHELVTWGPMAPSRSIDLGALLAEYTTMPTYDAATGRIAWSEQPQGARAGTVVATLYTVRAGAGWTWRIAVPRGESPEVAMPRLPDELAAFTPDAGSVVVEVTSLGSALELRPFALALDEPTTFATSSGELVRQALHFAGGD